MSWKKQLSNPRAQTLSKKQELFNRVYLANINDVRGKSITDKVARAKAMFELWRDTLASNYESTEELLEMYEEYLKEQKLI
jgi:hypothetical protein